MDEEYYVLITDAGEALEAAAHASGVPVQLAKFGVCDGGVDFVPDPTATTFENEIDRWAISSLTVSADDASVLVAQCLIPASSGGYTIRGIALYASDGTLYATGNYANQPKPAPDSGFAASLEILVNIAVSNTADITLTVNETIGLTKEQADTLYLAIHGTADAATKLATSRKIAGHDFDGTADIAISAGDIDGLGTAATADIVTSTTDTTAGRVMTVGYQGLGGNAISSAIITNMTQAPLPSYSSIVRYNTSGTAYYSGLSAFAYVSGGKTYFSEFLGPINGTTDRPLFRNADGIQYVFTDVNPPTAADTGALPLTGGTLTNDSTVLILKNKTQDETLNIMGKNYDNSERWFFGNDTNGDNRVIIKNSKIGNHIDLSNDGTILLSPTSSNYHVIIGNEPKKVEGLLQTVVSNDYGVGLYAVNDAVTTSGVTTGASIISANSEKGWEMRMFVSGDSAQSDVFSGYISISNSDNTVQTSFAFGVDGTFIPHSYSNFDARYVSDVQLGAGTKVTTWNTSGNWPNKSGYVITSVSKDTEDYNIDTVTYAPLQKKVGSTWYTVTGGTV